MKEYKRIRGIVLHGKGRGASLGFPTANVEHEESYEGGAYAGKVSIEGDAKTYLSALYLHPKKKLLEAHLLEYSGNLYDTIIEVELLMKLRDPEIFSSEDRLVAQIQRDVEKVRNLIQKKIYDNKNI